MTDNESSRRLSKLRRQADRSLRAFLRRTTLLTHASGPPGGVERKAGAATDSAGPDRIGVSVMGGPIFFDDERRMRALAKEIKRLISEDRRRGLGI